MLSQSHQSSVLPQDARPRMVTLQTMCKEGDLVGLRNFFCERPPPAVPFVANSETAETSDIGDSTDTALEAWRKIYPEANSRLNGQTLIEIASASGHIDVVKFLVEECRVDIYTSSENKQGAVYLACIGEHLDVMEYVVAAMAAQTKGTPSNAIASFSTSLLIACGQARKLGITKYVLKVLCDGQRDSAVAVLRSACVAGRMETVRFLMENYDVNPKSTDSFSALLDACENGHLDIVRFLVLEHRVCVRPKGHKRGAVLVSAARSTNFDLIRFLIDVCGTQVNEAGGRFFPKMTPVTAACKEGNLSVVRFLVTQCGATPPAVMPESDCESPIILACERGHLEVVTALVEEFGCDPATTSRRSGRSTLHVACKSQHLEVVRYLVLVAKVSPDIKDADGTPPIALACECNGVNVVKFLIEECGVNPALPGDSSGESLVLRAATNGGLDTIKYLVTKHDVDVERANKKGTTPLRAAIRGGNLDVFRYLTMECNVSLVAVGNRQPTTAVCDAFFDACRYGRLELAKVLVSEFGVDVEACNEDGDRAAYVASGAMPYRNALEMLQYLVDECGVDVQIATDGRTPMFRAATVGNVNVVRYLALEKKVNVETGPGEVTPLLGACARGHFQVVKVLITECGANVTATAKDGENVAHFASRNSSGTDEVLRYLVESCGVSPLETSTCSVTPLHVAAAASRVFPDIINYLVKQCGVPVDGLDKRTGETPFLRACFKGNEWVMCELAKLGANINHKLKDGTGAWHRVDKGWCTNPGSHNDYFETAQHMLMLGIDLDTCAIWQLKNDQLRYFLRAAVGLSPLERATRCFLSEYIPAIYRNSASDVTWFDRQRLILALSDNHSLWGYPTDQVYDTRKIEPTKTMLESAAVPWSPRQFQMVHRAMRIVIRTVMMIGFRLSHTNRHTLAGLPFEMWIHILSFCRREHFAMHRSGQPKEQPTLPTCTEH